MKLNIGVIKGDGIGPEIVTEAMKVLDRMNIGVIKGDGIGPEIVTEAMKVLDRTAEVYGHECVYTQLLMGGASIDVHGVPLTDETISKAKLCDAVLMGSIGEHPLTYMVFH